MAEPDKRPAANRRRLATTLREQIAARRTIADQVISLAHLLGRPARDDAGASVVPLSTAYAIADATGAPRSVSASFRQAPLCYGIFTPMPLTSILILAYRSTVLGAAKNGPIFKTVATVCVAVVGVLSFVVLVETVFGLG